jgi:hypothetical protein
MSSYPQISFPEIVLQLHADLIVLQLHAIVDSSTPPFKIIVEAHAHVHTQCIVFIRRRA